jgi:translation initiation factor IF-3
VRDATGVDLIMISPAAKPPVVKLIDYGKFKYRYVVTKIIIIIVM